MGCESSLRPIGHGIHETLVLSWPIFDALQKKVKQVVHVQVSTICGLHIYIKSYLTMIIQHLSMYI